MKWLTDSRLPATVISVVTIVLVLSPIVQNWRSEPNDDFPLSHYPMFTTVRRQTTSMVHAVGVKADGTIANLPHWMAGSGGMNQLRRQMSRMVKSGRALDLCKKVARRVARSRDPRFTSIVSVLIVRSRYNTNAFFKGETEPIMRTKYAHVTIMRRR